MKRLLLTAAVALLCGCNANLGLQIGHTGRSATAPSVGPGGSFSSGGVGISYGDAPGLGSLLGAVGLGWLLGKDAGARIPPAMDKDRPVNEQDCSQPVRDSAANLRCR